MLAAKKIVKDYEIERKVYAFDFTTIDLFLSVFRCAKSHKTKIGIKLHTLFDVETWIPAFVHGTPDKIHDTNAIEIIYKNISVIVF